MGVFYSKSEKKPPSEGICYGCRHAGDARFSDPNLGHCRGTGDLEASPYWPGFICTCSCVPPR